jgi:predicted enzyme related to lactoylglutathione lyase
MAQGEYNHIEIPYDNEERAKRFYSGVFGWEFSQMEGFPGYDLYKAGPGNLGGGLGKRGESAGTTTRNYILVDSVDDAVAKVVELGGTITEPKSEIPGQGWYAAGTDSEGNPLAVYETLPR